MWLGDIPKKPSGAERDALLLKREELVRRLKELKAKPLPKGDREQLAEFRLKDLKELATSIVEIDIKLGRLSV